MGFHHHICTPENPQANGFVEVFQKVLVKMVHTAVVEGKDPKKVVQRYLGAYRAAPHKTTGKSPFEMMFNRKMMTKLPQLPSKVSLGKKMGSCTVGTLSGRRELCVRREKGKGETRGWTKLRRKQNPKVSVLSGKNLLSIFLPTPSTEPIRLNPRK